MSRFAAPLMMIACLLYAAMPAWAAPMDAVAAPSMEMTSVAHARHQASSDHGMSVAVSSSTAMDHARHEGAKPCPHGARGCIAPFCAACLTFLPDMILPLAQRLSFSYPVPSPAPEMTPHGPDPGDPPPRG